MDRINKLLQDESTEFVAGEIKQLLLSTEYHEKQYGLRIANGALAKLKQLNFSCIEPSDALELLKIILSKNQQAELLYGPTCIQNLTETVLEQLNVVTIQELLNILDLYVEYPYMSKTLYPGITEKLVKLLELEPERFSQSELVRLMNTLAAIQQSKDLTSPERVHQMLFCMLVDRLQIINQYEFSRTLLKLSELRCPLPSFLETAILNQLERLPNLSVVEYSNLTWAVSNSFPHFDPNLLLKNQSSILQSIDKQPVLSLFRVLELLLSIKKPLGDSKIIQKVKACLRNRATSQFKDTVQYTYYLETPKIDKEELSEVSHDVFKFLLKNCNQFSAITCIKSTLNLVPRDKWEEKMASIYIDTGLVTALLRTKGNFPLTYINYFLARVPTAQAAFMLAIKRITGSEPLHDLQVFCKLLNNCPPLTLEKITSLNDFLVQIHRRNLAHEIVPFTQKINALLETCPVKDLRLPNSLSLCSVLASINHLDPSVAERVILYNLSQTSRKIETLLVSSKLPTYSLIFMLLPDSLLELDPRCLPEEAMNWLLAYLHWPTSSIDDKIQTFIKHKLNFVSRFSVGNFAPFIQSLGWSIGGHHNDLALSVLEGVCNILPKFQGKILTDKCILLLENLSEVQQITASDSYNAFLTQISEFYLKLSLEDKGRVLKALTQRGIRQRSLIESILSDILGQKSGVGLKVSALSALTELGFHNEGWAKPFVDQLLETVEVNSLPENLISEWLWSLLVVDPTHVKVAETIELRNKANVPWSFKDFLISNYCTLNSIPSVSYDFPSGYRHLFDFKSTFGVSGKCLEDLAASLDSLGIPSVTNTTIQGIWVPLYLPQQSKVLWPLTAHVQIYNNELLRGPFAMYKTQLESITTPILLTDLSPAVLVDLLIP